MVPGVGIARRQTINMSHIIHKECSSLVPSLPVAQPDISQCDQAAEGQVGRMDWSRHDRRCIKSRSDPTGIWASAGYLSSYSLCYEPIYE